METRSSLSEAEVSDRSRLQRAKHELPLTRAEEHEMHRKMHLVRHVQSSLKILKLVAFSCRAQDPMLSNMSKDGSMRWT